MKKVVLVSIKPKYVKAILEGRKNIELRKSLPKEVQNEDLLIIYSTYPEKAVVAFCQIGNFISDSPENIWKNHSEQLGINKSEYFDYYGNASKAIGIQLLKIRTLTKKMTLKEIKSIMPNFSPPQTYRYFDYDQMNQLFQNQLTFSY